MATKYGPDVVAFACKMVKAGACDREVVAAINQRWRSAMTLISFRDFRYRHKITRVQPHSGAPNPNDTIIDGYLLKARVNAREADEAFRKAMATRNKFKDDPRVPYEPVCRMDHPATHVETQSSAANAPV